MVTGSKELIRDINSHLVLDKILNEGPISRAAISGKLGITKATVSAIVSDLIDNKLVCEIGSDETSLGRKPILLDFCRDNGRIISVDLGVDTISVFTSNLSGQNCELKQYPNNYSKDNIISGLIRIIDETIISLPDNPFGAVGIAIGIHGTTYNNEITFAPYYDYAGLPIAGKLNAHFNIPVILENEANLSALGEKSFCYNLPNLIGISVHSGIGVGIIIDNALYSGANGNAGEFGHTIVVADGLPCPCGNKGCLEQYASERSILKEYSRMSGNDAITIDGFIAKYNEDDKNAALAIEQFVKYISVGINNLLNTFNPDVIVINSSFTIQIPTLIDDICAHVNSRLTDSCKILPSGLQDISILLGGVCLCIRDFLGVEIQPEK